MVREYYLKTRGFAPGGFKIKEAPAAPLFAVPRKEKE